MFPENRDFSLPPSSERENAAGLLFDLSDAAAADGHAIYNPSVRGFLAQHVTAVTDESSHRLFFIDSRRCLNGVSEVVISWQSGFRPNTNDTGTVTLTKYKADSPVMAEGSLFEFSLGHEIFRRIGFLWVPQDHEFGLGKPHPVTDESLRELYAGIYRAVPDREAGRNIWNSISMLYAIDDRHADPVEKLALYRYILKNNVFSPTELLLFAPTGYEEVSSPAFETIASIERFRQTTLRRLMSRIRSIADRRAGKYP